MADKKKKPKKKPDGRGSRPHDPNQLALWIVEQSTATAGALAIDDDCPVQNVAYGKLRDKLLADGQVLDK